MANYSLSIPSVDLEKSRINSVLAQMIETLWLWRFRYTSRRALRALDGHMRNDIGLDPSDAMRESLKPFWRA